MPFALSDDEELVQKTVHALSTEQIGLDAAAEADRHDRFPAGSVAAVGALGLFGLTAPPEAGGAGATAYALTVYELAQVCPNTAAILASHAGMAVRAATVAGEDAADLLAALAGGELAAWLSTEEAFGSEKGRFGTRAVAHGDDWLLTGQKTWGVSASDAKHYLVMAQAPEGPTLFLVDPQSPGVERGQNEPLLGMRAAGIRTVYLSGVRASRVLGPVGGGNEIERACLPWLQVGVAAALLGCVAGARKAANAFAEQRVQFQNPIGTYQAVSDGIVAMDVRLAAGRSLLLEAAAHLDGGGEEAALWAARAKEWAQELAVPMTRQAIRIQGGTGFMREGGTERFARDARALQFMGEPFAVQRDTIRRRVLALEFGHGP